MMDPIGFENEEHRKQEELRKIYTKGEELMEEKKQTSNGFDQATYLCECPSDIPARQIPSEEILPYFDWKMFYAIWGVKYGSSSMEAMELVQLRRDAEEEIALGNYKIMLTAKFYNAYTEEDDIVLIKDSHNAEMNIRLPMLRQEKGEMRSLCDFVIGKDSGKTSTFGCFAISVKAADAHEEGCCCPACSNKYEDLIGKAVRMTLAEAASKWLDMKLKGEVDKKYTIVKPAAGYSSCPDHTLKRDIFELLGINKEKHENCGHGNGCTCGHDHHHHHHHHNTEEDGMHIKLTESYAMIPEASICGTIFIHTEAKYHEIRTISQSQYDSYASRRGMNEETARRFLGHLLK